MLSTVIRADQKWNIFSSRLDKFCINWFPNTKESWHVNYYSRFFCKTNDSNHRLWTPNESFLSSKSQTFELGQTIWAFGGTAFISKPKYYLGLRVEFGLQRNRGFKYRVSVVLVLRDRSHWLWIHLSSHSILYFLQQITVISTQVFWLLVVRCEKSVNY